MPLEIVANKTYLLILLNQRIITLEQALENTEINAEDLDAVESINLAELKQMFANFKRYCGSPIWPSLVGSQFNITSHGPAGFAALSAPTLGNALTTFLKWHQLLRTTIYTSKIIEKSNRYEIVLSDATGDSYVKHCYYQLFARVIEILIVTIVGRPVNGVIQIYFEDTAKHYQSLLKEEFESTLFFGAEQNKLCIPKTCWFKRSPLDDPEAYLSNIQKCQQTLSEYNASAEPHIIVTNLIRSNFERNMSPVELPTPLPKLYEVAESLNLSERTLIRRLKNSNTSYKDILEELRKEYASKLLKNAKFNIADISDALGYQASSNFCRAFKTWYGVSPSKFRREKAPHDN